jgi:hypothetical protein
MSDDDLSKMFGPSAKAGGSTLQGLLPPRGGAQQPAAPAPRAPQPGPAPAEADLDEPNEQPLAPSVTPAPPPSPVAREKPSASEATRRASAGSGRTAGPQVRASSRRARTEPAAMVLDDDDTSQVSVYVLPAAKSAIRRLRTDQGKLNAEIAFDAIDAMSGRLSELVRARQLAPREQDSLFPARRTRRRARTLRQSGEPTRVLWTLQVTDAEHEVLDRLIADSGAEGVSQLVSAALEAYLLEESDTQARRA